MPPLPEEIKERMISVNNIRKGKLTTCLGVVLILAALVTKFIPSMEVSWGELVPVFIFGFGLFAVKDPKRNETKN